MIAWILPLFLLICMAPFSEQIDLNLSQYFYHDGFSSSPFFQFLYQYGYYPANAVAWGSALVVGASFFCKTLIPWRRLCIYLALVLALGAGLIVHGVLKDHWGRPRPRQIEQFGGTYAYQPFWKPNFFPKESTKSFVSGHAATGFYFFAIAIAAWHYGRKKWAYFWFGTALLLGFVIGFARIAQGGHFFTDIVGAGIVMWYSALILKPLINLNTLKRTP